MQHGTPAEGTLDPTLDRDARDALAWIEGGMPDSKIGYGPDAPKLTPEQLQEFEPASCVHASEVAPARRRAGQGK
ncbi:MAG: hypothetical protein M3Y41_14540 [Pseudomonadota bacterium]|nr:hypothetical protein [Pseudomonadota bacterium]